MKTKHIIKINAVLAAALLCLPIFLGCPVDAEGNDPKSQRTSDYPRYPVTGTMVVVFTNAATLKTLYHDYTPKDFSEVNCYEVQELNIQFARDGRQDLSIFQRMLFISVRGENAEAVLKSDDILMKRADIEYARVDTITGPYDPPSCPFNEPGTFEDLDLATEFLIKYDYAYTMRVPFNQISIGNYFGIYNSCAVVFMKGPFAYARMITRMEVAGFTFSWGSSNVTLVWKPGDGTEAGSFYRLNQAFDLGFLTEDDIKLIHERHYP